MAETTKAPKIYGAIAKVMEDVGVVGKNSKNQQQGFMFRGIDAVMNALNPAMVKNKVFVTPTILNEVREDLTTKNGTVMHSTRLTIRYDFYTEDGSSVSATVIGEAQDSGDKVTNKAMSIGFKYACFQTFCIPTEEMKEADPDNHSPEPTLPQYVDKTHQDALLSLAQKKGTALKEGTDITKLDIITWKKYMNALEAMPDADNKQVDLGL